MSLVGRQRGTARALNSLGAVYYFEGDLAVAQKVFNEALAICRELGDKSGIANALNNMAIVVQTQGNLVEASKLYIEHAVRNGKRLIPIVVRDIKGEESPAISSFAFLHVSFVISVPSRQWEIIS